MAFRLPEFVEGLSPIPPLCKAIIDEYDAFEGRNPPGNTLIDLLNEEPQYDRNAALVDWKSFFCDHVQPMFHNLGGYAEMDEDGDYIFCPYTRLPERDREVEAK